MAFLEEWGDLTGNYIVFLDKKKIKKKYKNIPETFFSMLQVFSPNMTVTAFDEVQVSSPTWQCKVLT